ncbi:CMP-N-acetlyneuraminic acid synthetase [Halobacillus litoralis]|uniref:CMP-N-acetlyneuraminic acid synthetase n=1 Tax=Halobacillus litoralis TaxID=45668 RepID=A0A845F7S1_9BACI|nr:acylneuraminate cytidylyltransferase family protein [Halobacillus litoralis]MYL69834.1 CMP-N-acetlyneuraminic acid synthetase [Halobacillus litoralis]
MSCLAIIPARSGSKGLVDKNVKLLNGKPLIAYTIEAAINSKVFDEVMVSTDSPKYAETAKKWGADVPFLRDDKFASDTASSWDAVRDVLNQYSKQGKIFDKVTLLQPTSPLRDAEEIIGAFNLMEKKDAETVVSVCEVDHSPLFTNTLPPSLSLNNFVKNDLFQARRQELPKHYRINGAIYIVQVKNLYSGNSLYNEKSFAYLMSKKKSIDIDDELDFKFAKLIVEHTR